jgi:predicted secreted hydrolase
MKVKKKLFTLLSILLPILILLLLWLVVVANENNNVNRNLLKELADDPQQLQKQYLQYKQASPTNEINFPQAHWPHKDYRHEWWYLTANLTSETGQRFATQWTLFRTAINNQHWYFAHAALADEQQHFAEFREGREELGTVKLVNTPFSVVINDWTWQSTEQLFPAQLTYGSPKYALQNTNLNDKNAQQKNWQANLSLSTSEPFYLQGDNGFSAKHQSENIASHYYSQPFIEVIGDIYWQGSWQKVSGSAWFDREWGSSMLAEDQQGWDWFSLRLNKDQALMVYRIRSKQQNFIYGNLMNSNGSSQPLTISDIELKGGIMGNTEYPESFTLTLEQMGIDLNIKIINENQVMRFGIEYFEGMVTFTGTHTGEGFVEMTGYH